TNDRGREALVFAPHGERRGRTQGALADGIHDALLQLFLESWLLNEGSETVLYPLAFDEGALDGVLARAMAGPFAKVLRLEQANDIAQHRGAAADHDTVVLRVEGRKAHVRAKFAALEHFRDASAIREIFTGDQRVVTELILDHLPQV